MSTNPTTPKPPLPLIEWLFWSAISAGVIVLYFTLGQRPPANRLAHAPSAAALIGLLPLVLSSVVRWIIIPRIATFRQRLPLFIIGVALAESCGLLGIFIGGPHKDTLFVLSLLGLAQFFPALLPRLGPTSPFR